MRSFVSKALTLGGMAAITLVIGCGGGGGGGGGNEATPTPEVPDVFYVRASGDDVNEGRSPDTAVRTLERAVALVTEGATVIVGPGTYGRLDVNRRVGTAEEPIVFDADPSGTMTGDSPGPVRIVLDDGVFGIRLTQSPYIIIDGFTITGARANNGAGIIVRSSSHNATIRNCELTDNADGVRAQDSNDLTIFNNLIAENVNRGMFIGASASGAGSQRARVISNTIVRNGGAGIFIGNNEVASAGAVLRNNIIQDNSGRNFDVDNGPPSSAEDLTADYNLVFKSDADPACSAESQQSACGYGPVAVRGENDINADAEFTAPNNQEFFLDQRNSPAVDASDPELDSGFADVLRGRTTSTRGNIDEDPLDLGYHAPQPES
jgi:parallel beta-helix repeat protein